jgi:NADH-quinone oxidoreductase subunit N
MVVAGLGYKIAAAPFHFYAPDVYQGAPICGAGLLAFVPKVAGFVAILRLFGFVRVASPDLPLLLGDQVSVLFWILAAVTMTLGNVLALLQNNLRRLLAYSGIAHAGYMLVGLAVAQSLDLAAPPTDAPSGVTAMLFYLVAYAAMTLGAFGVLAYLDSAERRVETEDDLAGLSESQPGVALLMALFLLSLIGIPMTAGFMGKLFLLTGALAVDGPNAVVFRWLALVMAVNAAIGGWYYLRVLAKIYLYPSATPIRRPFAWPGLLALWICAAATLAFGVQPAWLYEPMRRVSTANMIPTPQSQISTSARPSESMSAGVLNGPGLTRTVPSGNVPSAR